MADTLLMDSSPFQPLHHYPVCLCLYRPASIRTLRWALVDEPGASCDSVERVLPSLYRPQRPSFHLAVGLPRQRSHPPIGL